MSRDSHENNMPLGLAMALAQSSVAMKNFGVLSELEQEKLIERARSVHSKKEMKDIVSELAGE